MASVRNIVVTANEVARPAGPHTPTIHQFLNYLHSDGFSACPKPLGVADGVEILSLVEGETYDYPLCGAVASEEALRSAAVLLKTFHEASALYLPKMENCRWALEPREPVDVICHGDFAPYNVALKGNSVVGVFDFDTSHPGPRIWDLAYAVYCWAPFKTHKYDEMGTLTEQCHRARMFCDHYGASESEKHQLADEMANRLRALVTFMETEAAKGNAQFQQHLAMGHDKAYLKDIDYLIENKLKIIRHFLNTL
ncbi:phosphotransferase enzyme family protein [Enterovibrio nigricans]|uniref:Phosphotransferase enzyme family protein n=1 Tax=Enterovibrio nigricans DSM 22720 TaxID=1121868 RepID=A0A1T4VAS9_9GAMM|nr:phosphotransferase [Enterovibrio nigricans]SKA62033.1 Phosphotransferase enzyme family protein [Enterovibrio nigricans DSM 22720]